MTTITRFAPSPTGPLHLGGARTALFNYLFAQNKNGKFKLRIEDTDQNRNTIESSKLIIESLNWLGLKIDGETIYQSKNYKEHLEIANSLISKGMAYKCFHDREFLERYKNNKEKFKSEWRDNNNTPSNKPFCIRIKAPLNGDQSINDNIQGKITVSFDEIDDYIIVRDDGTPTFLLSSAVDDYNMKVTDIIRGDDHLTNSFRQKLIFDFINYKPEFSHISLIHNQNNQKMSKRDNSSSILDFKHEGYLPEAILNYLIRLGWSHGDKEIFTMEEAKKLFSINKIGKSPAKFDKKKLDFLNSFYIKNKTNSDLLTHIKNNKGNENCIENFDDQNNLDLIGLFKERAITLNEISHNILKLFKKDMEIADDQLHILEDFKFKKYKDILIAKFSDITDWNEINIENIIKELIQSHEISFKSIAQPLRISLTGCVFGPSLYKIIRILGKEVTIQRIKNI